MKYLTHTLLQIHNIILTVVTFSGIPPNHWIISEVIMIQKEPKIHR